MSIQHKLNGFILLIGALCSPAAARDVELRKAGDTVVDPKAIYFVTPSWGNAVNGQSFQHDALTTFNGYQYATYYNSARRVCIARRPLGGETWDIIEFEDHEFRGNDTHNVTVLGVSETDGTIHLCYDRPMNYRLSSPGAALRPEEVEWTADLFGPVRNGLNPDRRIGGMTYPRFIRTPTGALQFGCRLGGSGQGNKCLADYDPETGEWQNLGAFAGGQGVYKDSHSRNAYLNELTYDRRGRLHVTWVWRESPNPMTNHDLSYAWSDDLGMTWFNNAGEKIAVRGEPATIESPGLRAVEIPMRRGLMNAMTQAVDSRSRIHVVTFHIPDDAPQPANWNAARPATRYFHYWRGEEGEWHRTEMDFNGGRPQMWFDSRDNAYFVFTGDRFNPSLELSIVAASAASGWTDWKVIHRESGAFTGQPQIDRHSAPDLLSIYVQEQPAGEGDDFSPLRVIDFEATR